MIEPRLVTAETPAEVSTWPTVSGQEPERLAFALSNAGLYGADGVIYERPTRRAIRETLDFRQLPPSHHPAMGLHHLSPPRQLDGTSVFIGGVGGQTFFHFFIEILPQLRVLAESLPSARRLIVQGYIEPAKEAWLRHSGVRLPITWLLPLDHLLCEELVFCMRVVHQYQPNPWALETVRDFAGVRAAPASRRARLIWAERRRSHMRPIAWEDDVIRQLPAPWESVDFSALSPAQTLALCSECAAFAGFHGAAFANLALCPPGVRVYELYQEPKESWYPALSAVAGHVHCVAMAAIGPVAIREQLVAEASRHAA